MSGPPTTKQPVATPALLAGALDSVPDSILVIDLDHRVVFANRSARMKSATAAGELRCYELTHGRSTPCDGTGELCPLRRVAESRAPLVVTHTHQGADGMALREEVMASPLIGDTGEVTHIVEVCRDVTQRTRLKERLQEARERIELGDREREGLHAQLDALASELAEAEVRERRRVSELLHDHLQQILVGAKLAVNGLRGARPADSGALADRLDQALDQAIGVTRSLAVEISPQAPLDSGLIAALSWLARTMRRRHGLTVRLEAEEAADPDDEKLRLVLFQAVREALFNVVKHAHVRHAEITMRLLDGETEIVVADSGDGFDPHSGGAGTGLGLPTVARRLHLLGGRLTVDSAPGRGTRVVLVAPPQPPNVKS